MQTECNPELFEFAPVESRRVVAAFDGEALQAIVDLDLGEICAIEPPRGFARD